MNQISTIAENDHIRRKKRADPVGEQFTKAQRNI